MGAVNKIIGVCRFSYLGDAGFRTLAGGAEQAAKALYAPGRMQRRFAYFENICLPSLDNQTDQDFVLVALIGDTMPFHFRKRLKRSGGPAPVSCGSRRWRRPDRSTLLAARSGAGWTTKRPIS